METKLRTRVLSPDTNHPQVWVPDRNHWIDEAMLPICRKLWDAGIETFYSCQGGPGKIVDGVCYSFRAYVQILEIHAMDVCGIVADLNPEICINPKRTHQNRCAIRFDPVS